MNYISTINKFLKGEAATLLLLAMALIAQTPHTATVFHRLAPETVDAWANLAAWSHAAAYAVALEFATLVFVVRGQKRLAWLFAVASVLVNAAYYYRPGIGWADGARAVLICLALPACIAFYSHSVAESEQKEVAQDAKSTVQGKQKPIVQKDAQIKTASKQQTAKQMHAEGFSIAQIAANLKVHRNTVSAWVRETNGHSKVQA